MELRGAPRARNISEAEAERILNAVLDAGINYIDTSIGPLQGMTPVEFVLRFTFAHPDMDTTIVGTVNPAHLDTNLAALRKGPLPANLYAEAKRRLAAAGLAPRATSSEPAR
jgi:aryl-alcohol dehydrogenase-like predicted oxidoreductase